ncbi:glycosyltransferase family 2 protein [Candidatus Woesearchaeota archaeon]|nr:glycosyltransferase family 2 protein [Candidatus Woesearchaeota archaeon]
MAKKAIAKKKKKSIKAGESSSENKEGISLVILVYNRADVIEGIIREFFEKVISKVPNSEFIIAEDGSTDGTKEILAKLKKELPIRLVQGKERKGYIKAMTDSMRAPRREIVFRSDADGEHLPEDFWKLYPKIDDYDAVVGYKVNRKPYYRLVISRVNNFFIGLLFGLWLKDANCGFLLIRKKVIDDVVDDVGTLRWAINAEVLIRAKQKGYSITQVPVQHRYAVSEVFPLKKMPKVIWQQFSQLFVLKKELNRKKSGLGLRLR